MPLGAVNVDVLVWITCYSFRALLYLFWPRTLFNWIIEVSKYGQSPWNVGIAELSL